MQSSLGGRDIGQMQEVGGGLHFTCLAGPLLKKKKKKEEGAQLSFFAHALGPRSSLAPFQTVAASQAPTLKGLRCFA